MKTSFNLDTRELRSFKLRYNLQFFNLGLKNPEIVSSFFVADSLYPKERAMLTEQFLKQKIKVTLLPKKINRTLFNLKDDNTVLNLLKGQIFLIQTSKENFFVKENLKNLLFSNKFFLRLVVIEKSLYRKKHILNLMENCIPLINAKILLAQTCLQYSLALLNVLAKIKREK